LEGLFDSVFVLEKSLFNFRTDSCISSWNHAFASGIENLAKGIKGKPFHYIKREVIDNNKTN